MQSAHLARFAFSFLTFPSTAVVAIALLDSEGRRRLTYTN